HPCAVISPHEEFEKFFGKAADKRRKLYNGMIKCLLFSYYK
ncbi:MAG: class I SAM-dependent RNA methyltransferase, partial [Ruminococcus sp.]|nr:class I SAM-dependent RNA methyltransferase [Ruminococcus sp.]